MMLQDALTVIPTRLRREGTVQTFGDDGMAVEAGSGLAERTDGNDRRTTVAADASKHSKPLHVELLELPEVIDLGKPGQDCFSDGVWHPEGHVYVDEVVDEWDDGDCPPELFWEEVCKNCGKWRSPTYRGSPR